MCTNINNLYLKFGVSTLIATIVGILSGIVWQQYLLRPTRYFLAQAFTASVVLILLASYLLFRTNRSNQNATLIKYYIRYQVFGATGSLAISVIALSTTLTAGILSSVVVGLSVAFFVVLIASSIFTMDYLLKNSCQNKE